MMNKKHNVLKVLKKEDDEEIECEALDSYITELLAHQKNVPTTVDKLNSIVNFENQKLSTKLKSLKKLSEDDLALISKDLNMIYHTERLDHWKKEIKKFEYGEYHNSLANKKNA